MARTILIIILVCSTVVVGLGQDKKGSMKFPVPDREAQAKAEKTIKEIFKDEYAKKKPAEKIELANKLLQQGAETNDDPAAKYILFREARDLASKSGDVALALKAVDELVMQFELSPVEEKFTTLDVLERASTTSAANKSIFEVMMAFVEERLRADDYDLAMKSLKIAQSAAAKTRIAANVAIVYQLESRKWTRFVKPMIG